MRVLRVCAPAHTGSAILAKPLELSKDGMGSSSGDNSGVSADGAGGIRVAFFVIVCRAHVYPPAPASASTSTRACASASSHSGNACA